MIFPSNRVRIMAATKPIDFRKGHDSLAAMVKNELRKDPFTGTVFVLRAKKADHLKLLYWDGTGLVMACKRLEEHTFIWPAVTDGVMLVNHAQLEALFAGLDWRRVAQLAVLAFEGLHLLGHLAGDTGPLAAVDLGLVDPVIQGLRCASDLR